VEENELNIENRLRELRKQRNLSQEELADALGISRQSVIALEQGRFMPSLPLAVTICQFFNSAFEDMFEFENSIREIHNGIEKIEDTINKNDSDQSGSRKENMVELEPWRPLREAVTLRDAIDRLFEDSVITPGRSGVAMPKIDVIDKKDSLVVKAELPGMKEDQIEVEVKDNMLTISGEKKEEKEEEKEGYYYKESHSGSFSRTVSLPAEVMADKADASMNDGVLTITVPKVEEKKAKKLEITRK